MWRSSFLFLCLSLLFGDSVYPQSPQDDPSSLVEAALAADPTVARLRAEVRAAQEAARVAAARPNPMLMGGVQNLEADLGQDRMMTMYMVGASQQFPRASKLARRETAARLEAEALEATIESRTEELRRDVILAWLEVAQADAEGEVLARSGQIVDAIAHSSRVRYEIGGASQSDVIRAQLAMSVVERDRIRTRGTRRSALARLLPLTGLDSLDVPTLSLPALPEPTTAEALVIGDAHAGLRALQLREEAQGVRIELAELAERPDLEIEASYGHRTQEVGMVSVVAKIELPLRRGSAIEPAIREAVALRDAARYRREELRRALVADLARIVADHDEAREQMALYEEVLVPQARLAVDSSFSSYQTGGTSFDSILAAQNALVRLELERVALQTQILRAVVEYEALSRGARSSSGSPMADTASIDPSPARGSETPAMSGM